MSGIETTYNDFPDGLRCNDCSREIQWGEPHFERAEGMIDLPHLTDEPTFEVSLICRFCEAQAAGRIVPILDGNLNPL